MAFILLSLMTKLLAISHEVEERKLWYVMETVSVLVLFVLFLRMRLTYTLSLPAQETVFYKAAVLLDKQLLSVGGMDILPQLLHNPAQYAYSIVVWLVFQVTGVSPSVIIYINTAILFLTVFFVYRIVRRLGGRVCGILSVACSLFMPSQSFTVYSYNTELFFACILFAALSVFVYLSDQKEEEKRRDLLLYGLFGLLLGLLLFTEPLAVIIAGLLLIDIFCRRKNWLRGFVSAAAMLAAFLVLFFGKGNTLECTDKELIQAYWNRFSVTSNIETGEQYEAEHILNSFHLRLDSQNAPIADNYYFLSKGNLQTYTALQAAWFQLGNQLFYLFLIVLSMACAYCVIKGKNAKVVPCLLSLIGAVLILFWSANKERNTWFFVELLIITGCVSLHYLYENYRPAVRSALTASDLSSSGDTTVIEAETEEEKEIWLARARALVFIGENDVLYEKIKAQEKGNQTLALRDLQQSVNIIMDEKEEKPMNEEKKEIQFLENPLPLPKPHVSKIMDYSFDMEEDAELDFDIEVRDEDDFEV